MLRRGTLGGIWLVLQCCARLELGVVAVRREFDWDFSVGLKLLETRIVICIRRRIFLKTPLPRLWNARMHMIRRCCSWTLVGTAVMGGDCCNMGHLSRLLLLGGGGVVVVCQQLLRLAHVVIGFRRRHLRREDARYAILTVFLLRRRLLRREVGRDGLLMVRLRQQVLVFSACHLGHRTSIVGGMTGLLPVPAAVKVEGKLLV